MEKVETLWVKYHDESVGTLTLTADKKQCVFEYDAQWLAPAYDLTHCTEGYNGEHATSVNQSSHPSLDDMIAVGVKNKMTEKRCREIYEEVRAIISSRR